MITSNEIYKKDSTGRTRFWRYEVDGDRWRSIAGICGGTEVTSGWTTCTPASQPTAEAQAEFEAQAEESKKLARHYRRSMAELDGPMMFSPMLAKPFKDFSKLKGRVWAQPKFDGMRCATKQEGMFSREGKPITGLPHILEALQPVFAEFPDIVIDGELYNHDFKDGFEKLISACRKRSDHPDAQRIQLHIYDVDLGGDEPYSERLDWLREHIWQPIASGKLPACLKFAETHEVTGNASAATKLDEDWVEEGYEGSMLRLDMPYKHGPGRASQLLKRKEFEEGEFEIVDILEGNGNWAGKAKMIHVRMPNGEISGATLMGDYETNRLRLLEKDQYIGGQATIKYFNFTADGMLRKPSVKILHKGKRDY